MNQIIKPNADELDFDFDMLGRLREYETSSRESAFAMDGTKRLGDFEDKTDEWRRYHWCKQHLLGYKDDSDTYYFLTEPDGSVEVIFTHGGTAVNRLEYDFLGKLRNQTTTPQVELLWRGKQKLDSINFYVLANFVYTPQTGSNLSFIPYDDVLPHYVPVNPNGNDFGPCYIFWLPYFAAGFFATVVGGLLGVALSECVDARTTVDAFYDQWQYMAHLGHDHEAIEAYLLTIGYLTYNAWDNDYSRAYNHYIAVCYPDQIR